LNEIIPGLNLAVPSGLTHNARKLGLIHPLDIIANSKARLGSHL
jgi:hypothetical protein